MAATRACLDRIARLNPALRAFITVTADSALAGAAAADRAAAMGSSLGPLHGVPIAVKDCIDVAGVRCTMGSSFFADNIAARDAAVVARLRAAGAVILGKTNLHEFAYGGTTQNAFYGACRNPWDTARIPGGSSGGSAVAVAAGLAAGALGTDTGASVRLPAALTGITGLRPTFRSVSADGIFPVSPPYDIAGPMARSVADVARLLVAMVEPSVVQRQRLTAAVLSDCLEADLSGLRVAIPDDFFFAEAEPAVADAVLEAARVIERHGARLMGLALPGAAEAQDALLPVLFADAAALHRDRLETHPEGFSIGVRRRLEPGLAMRAVDYARSLRWLETWQRRCAAFFGDEADLMLTPTVPRVAPEASDDAALTEVTSRLTRFAWCWPAARLPALTVPCGFVQGLPVGMQLAAGRWREPVLLAVGHRFQQATDWHRMPPGDSKPPPIPRQPE